MGPYTFDEVRQYLASGHVLATDWAWHPGLTNWIAVSELPGLTLATATATAIEAMSEPEPVSEAPAYHHVSMARFIVYSICSLGIYELFWAYKNWKFIKDRDGSRIMPFWRAVFLPLWCYSLTKDIADTRGGARHGIISLVAAVYFVISVLWRLPDPYWLISLGNFIPLLYPVKLIHDINHTRGVTGPHYSRVRKRHIVGCVFGALILALVVADVSGLMPTTPDTRVVSGEQLSSEHAAWLRETGIVKPDEQIEYFYSTAVFSIRSEGYIVTDKGVAAYERPDGQLNVLRASYPEIKNIDVTYSESWLEDTQVLIEPRDKDGFYLLLSAEGKVDRRCVERLMALWKQSLQVAPEER